MPDYRRWYVEGGTYFFTVVTHSRRRFLTDDEARPLLRAAIEKVRKKWPFDIPAFVLLPDHLHAIWTLPPPDDRYGVRWQRIKEEFSEAWLASGGWEGPRSASRKKRKERGVWQRRFWEHTIRDEDDFERHFDYVHYNPVKHGYVDRPMDWPWSSFHRWVRESHYDAGWGAGPLDFSDLDETAME